MATRVFDVHQHLGGLREAYRPDRPIETDEAAQRRRAVMERHGITAAAVMPPPLYDQTDGWKSTRELNARVAEYRDRHVDVFPVGFGVVEPLHDLKSCLHQLDALQGELGLQGVVWHHKFHGVSIDDPRMDALVEEVHSRGLRILVHIYAESKLESPWSLMRLARRHPDVPMVALDAFTSVSQAKDVVTIAAECPNLLFETAGAFPIGRIVERFIEQVGADRVVFGSQLYIEPQWWLVPHVLEELRVSPDVEEAALASVLWENSARLFGLGD